MKLVPVRHGESEWNRLNLFTGRRDVELSEKGRQDATECGRLLREDGFEFDEQFQVRKKYDLGNQDDIQKRADLAGSTSRSHG